MRVNGMPARQHGCWFNRIKQIFQANGAVRVKTFRIACMIKRRNTHATIVAMHKIIITFYTTNSAFIAMIIISLNSVIKKIAHGAKIGGELDATLIVAARLRHGLPVIAHGAHHFFDFVPIHFMGFRIVVAVTAHILFVATRGHQAASAHIVLATHPLI